MKKSVFVITGISNGNGKAMCQLFSKVPGAHIIGVDLKDCSSDVKKHVSNFIIADVSELESSRKILGIATNLSNNVFLINNAGITKPNINKYAIEDFDHTLSVNLRAPFVWLEDYRNLVECNAIKSGGVVNICSLASHVAFPHNPAYIAAKHGLLGLTKYYALALGKKGIRVNSVSPGYVKTEMTADSYRNESRRALISGHSFLNRWAESSEVASTVRFLLSEESSFITGADIPVDGGWLSRGMYLEK